MKRLAATILLFLFASVSTFANFVVVWCIPSQCDVGEPVECGPSPGAEYVACGALPKPCADEDNSSPACPDEDVHFVWPISLAIDPSQVPCCAQVCASGELSDFRLEENSTLPFDGPANLTSIEIFDFLFAKKDRPEQSRPVGLHISIPSTVLRL